MNELSEWLQLAISECRIPEREIAKQAGLTMKELKQIQSCDLQPSRRTIRRLSEICKVDLPDEILYAGRQPTLRKARPAGLRNLLVQLMFEFGMTPDDIAALCEITSQTVRNIIHGKSFSDDTYHMIARGMCLTDDELILLQSPGRVGYEEVAERVEELASTGLPIDA